MTSRRKATIACSAILASIAAIVVGLLPFENGPQNGYKSEQLRPYYDAQTLTLFSLDPVRPLSESGRPLEGHGFQGYTILGEHIVSDASEVREVIKSIERAAQHWTRNVSFCFNPRHGIRAVHEGKNHDLLICYECTSAHLLVGSDPVGWISFDASPDFAATPSLLNDILNRAGVKLPPPPKH